MEPMVEIAPPDAIDDACHRAGCGNRIPVADLEAIFYEELKAFILTPERIDRHLKTANEAVNEKEKLLSVQRKEIERIREEMAKTHRLYLAGQIPMEGFSGFYNPLQERLSQLQSELPKLEAEVAHL
jgi:site-specific DNA recombinase